MTPNMKRINCVIHHLHHTLGTCVIQGLHLRYFYGTFKTDFQVWNHLSEKPLSERISSEPILHLLSILKLKALSLSGQKIV